MVPALVCRAQYPVVAGPGADSLRSSGGHSVREEVEIFLEQRHTTKLPSISAAAAVLRLRPFPWAGLAAAPGASWHLPATFPATFSYERLPPRARGSRTILCAHSSGS